jgi:hypothetical protein
MKLRVEDIWAGRDVEKESTITRTRRIRMMCGDN